MESTKLSTKGQVIIPKAFRTAHRWAPGLELALTDTGDGLLLRPKSPFALTRIENVAGMVKSKVAPKNESQMRVALRKSIRKKWLDRG
jgi:AbrB family looped-hinge helix DNA binding protein